MLRCPCRSTRTTAPSVAAAQWVSGGRTWRTSTSGSISRWAGPPGAHDHLGVSACSTCRFLELRELVTSVGLLVPSGSLDGDDSITPQRCAPAVKKVRRSMQQMPWCRRGRAPAHDLSSRILLAELLRILLLRTAAALPKPEMVHQSLEPAEASQQGSQAALQETPHGPHTRVA